MAVTMVAYYYGVSPEVIIKTKKPSPRRRPLRSTASMNTTGNPNKICTATHLHKIRLSSKKNKVFEDQSKGIVCYREENGEITCEGFDEGPRFHHCLSTTAASHSTRDAEIVDLLHRCLASYC